MIRQQKGFAALEAILIVVVVAIIGGTGYFVWHSRQAADKTLADANKSTNADIKKSAINSFEDCKKLTSSKILETYPEQCVTAGGKTFVNTAAGNLLDTSNWHNYSGLGASLSYPGDWRQEKIASLDPKEWVSFVSPDFVAETSGAELSGLKAGLRLELNVSQKQNYENYEASLSNAKTSKVNFGGAYEIVTVDGIKAVMSSSHSEGSSWTVYVYKGDKSYFLRLNALDVSKPEITQLFKTILATVKIN